MIRTLMLSLALGLAAPASAGTVTRAADGTHVLAHEVVVDAPASEVWQAISTVGGWKSWAVPVAWTDPADPDVIETSYDPAATPGSAGTIRQRLVARVPGERLIFRTVKAPTGFTDFDSFAKVISTFELTPLGPRRTRVRLTGAGYPDTEAGKRLLGFFDRGNAASLEMLRARFESGPIDWKEKLKKPIK